MARNILVATDGSEGSAGALQMGRRLQTREDAHVELLAVCPPIDLYPAGYIDAIAPFTAELTVPASELLRARVQALATRVGWGTQEVLVEFGGVAVTIARVAAQRRSELILLGLAAGEGLGHWRARETLLRLTHLAHVPVLAVPAASSALPREILVGSDFSEFSVRAAQEAVRDAEAGARLHLIHVIPEFTWTVAGPVVNEWATAYRAEARERVRQLAHELALSGRVTVREHVRVGDPAEEILKLANELGADLVATGSHGRGYFARMILGSVSGRLIHESRSAILISPPPTIPEELHIDLTEGELMAGLGRAGEMASGDPTLAS